MQKALEIIWKSRGVYRKVKIELEKVITLLFTFTLMTMQKSFLKYVHMWVLSIHSPSVFHLFP